MPHGPDQILMVSSGTMQCVLANVSIFLTTESESLSELESMDPQKRELLEARILRKVSVL